MIIHSIFLYFDLKVVQRSSNYFNSHLIMTLFSIKLKANFMGEPGWIRTIHSFTELFLHFNQQNFNLRPSEKIPHSMFVPQKQLKMNIKSISHL